MGRARRAGPCAVRRRDGEARRLGRLCRRRSSTCAPAPSSRSPMPAGLPAPRSPPARPSTRRARFARRSGPAAPGRSRRASGTVTADWVAVATDAYGGAPWPQDAARADPPALFQFRHRPALRRTAGLDPAGPRGLLGHAQDHELFPLRPRRAAHVWQRRARCAGSGLAVHRAWAKRALKKIFPRIGDVAFEHQWYGMIGMTDERICPASIASPTTS